MILWAALAWGDELDDRLARVRASDDYGEAVVLAADARAAGRPELAIEAWAVAERASGGSLETAMGPVVDLVAAGDGAAARAHAGDAVRRAPELASAWSLRGWAWRDLQVVPDLGARVAAASYRRAEALGGGDAACGLAWTRAASGNLVGARAAAARATEGCAPRLPSTLTAWGGLFGAVSTWTNNPYRAEGGHVVAQAGLSWDGWLDADVTGRFTSIGSLDAAGAASALNQGEGWGRVTVHHDGLGASAVVGGLALTGERRATTVGGTLWGTWGVTLAGSGAWTRYDDGAAWQAGGTLTVPVQPWLRVGGGAGATGFTADADATSTEDGGPHLSGHAFASLTRGPVSVGLSGTFGQEVRPIRLSDPTIYNLGYVVSGTGSLDLGVRVAGPVSVVGGYDLLHLVSTGTDPMFVHYVTLGVVVSATRERSEEVR